METVSIAYVVAPQLDHETRICKLDCISPPTDTAKCAGKKGKTENANM